jgi:hypothetical protein
VEPDEAWFENDNEHYGGPVCLLSLLRKDKGNTVL